jgi:hypothetical protein
VKRRARRANGDFPDDPNINAVAGVAGTTLLSGTSGLTVNSTGAFFNDDRGGGLGTNITGGTDAAEAFIVLHELAHLTGAVGFLPNDRSAVDAHPQVRDRYLAW